MTLRPLDVDQIRSLHEAGSVNVDGTEVRWHDDDVHNLAYRLEAFTHDAGSAPYLVHVVLDGPVVAARIGAHAAPVDGQVEIGYFVEPGHRGRGLATRVVGEFLDWLRTQGVTRVRATVQPGNDASVAVLARNGFEHRGEEIEEDGEVMQLLVREL
jgi:RimJ/RimL family protein N-acetyltransferase